MVKHAPFRPGVPLILGQLSTSNVSVEDCGQWPLVAVLGVQKAATTSLAVALEHQAKLASAERQRSNCCHRSGWRHCTQETHWFQDRSGVTDMEDFPYLFDAGRPAYDATPEQLTDPAQPTLMAMVMPPQLQPYARFIIIFREPSSRLMSWYNHRVAQELASVEKGGHCGYCGFCSGGGKRAGKLVEDAGVFSVDGRRFSPSFDEEALCELAKVATRPDEDNLTRALAWYREPDVRSKSFFGIIKLTVCSVLQGWLYITHCRFGSI